MVTKIRTYVQLLSWMTSLLFAASGLAQVSPEPKPAPPPPQAEAQLPPRDKAASSAHPGIASEGSDTPASLHHTPISTAQAHEPLRVFATVNEPQKVRHAWLIYSTKQHPKTREIEFLRNSDTGYVAEVPATEMGWPWLRYSVELEGLDGSRIPIFATREAPHRVLVPEDMADVRETALSTRFENRRSVFSSTAEWVSFGSSEAFNSQRGSLEAVSDHYYRVEGSYTYRPFRTVAQFSIRAGIVRGRAPIPIRARVPGQSEEERYDVGLNYGAPTVRFRLSDSVHMDAELLSSVTERGFSAGCGSAILFGDPYGANLTLGFESIQVFGTRFFSRVDVVANDKLTFSPIVEVTDMPSADNYGVRLLAEVTASLGRGLRAAARGGLPSTRCDKRRPELRNDPLLRLLTATAIATLGCG